MSIADRARKYYKSQSSNNSIAFRAANYFANKSQTEEKQERLEEDQRQTADRRGRLDLVQMAYGQRHTPSIDFVKENDLTIVSRTRPLSLDARPETRWRMDTPMDERRKQTAVRRAAEEIRFAFENPAEAKERRSALPEMDPKAAKNSMIPNNMDRTASASAYLLGQNNPTAAAWYTENATDEERAEWTRLMEIDPGLADKYVTARIMPKVEQYSAQEQAKKYAAAAERVEDIASEENWFWRNAKQAWLALESGAKSSFTVLANRSAAGTKYAPDYTSEAEIANQMNIARKAKDGDSTFALEALTAVGNMLPSVALGSTAGGALMATQAYSGAYLQAKEDGASDLEANLHGMIVGGFEYALNKALGGVSALAGKTNLGKAGADFANRLTSKMTRNAATKLITKAAMFVGRTAPEFLEESIQTVVDNLSAKVFYGQDINWPELGEDALKDGLLGLATAGILNLATSPRVTAARKKQVQLAASIADDNGDIVSLMPKPLVNAIVSVERGGSVSNKQIAELQNDLTSRVVLAGLEPSKELGISQRTLDTVRKAVGMQPMGVSRETNATTEVSEQTTPTVEETTPPVVSENAQPVIDALLTNKPISGNQANKVLDDIDALRYAEDLLGVDTSMEKTISGKRAILVKAAQDNAETQAKILQQSELENWKTTAVEENQGEDKPPVYSLSQLLEAFSKVFDVNVRVGNLASKNTLGEHNLRTGSVKIKTTNDLPSTAHEIGHVLDRISGITKKAPKDVTEELKANLSDKMKKLYKPNKYVSEGMAEYAREFILNYENAAAKYPKTTAYLQNNLPAKTLERLQFIARHTNRYFSSTTAERLHATNHPRENVFKLPMDVRASNFVENKKDAAITKYTDDLYGIVKAANNTENKQQAQNLYDAYVEAQVARQMDEKLIQDAIYGDGVKEFDGNVLAPSLVQSLQPVYDGLKKGAKTEDVQNRVKEFEDYLNVVEAIDRLQPIGNTDAKTAYGDVTLNEVTTLKKEVEQMEKLHPEFKDAAQNIYYFSRALLWLEVQAEIITEETFNRLVQEHPHYVPFYRDMSGTDSKKVSGSNKPLIQKATGSARDFAGTIEGLALNASKAIKDSHQNTIAKKICLTIDGQPGMAWLLEKNNKQTTVEKYDSDVIFNEMVERAGENADKNVIDYIQSLLEKDIITYGADVLKGNRDVVVFENGKPVSYHVNDTALYTALTSLDSSSGNNVYAAKVITDANKMFTSVVTGGNIIWNISSNMPRDFITMLAQSDTTQDMFMNLANWMKYLAMTATSTRKISSYAREYFELMGGQSSQIGAEVKSIGKRKTDSVVKTLDYQNKTFMGKAWHKIKHPFATTKNSVLSIAEAVELIPRLAAYETARKNGKSQMDALFDSMEITTNFTRHGSSTHKANRYIPFLNASVQGLSKGYRQLTGVNYKGESRKQAAFRHATKYIALSAVLSMVSMVSRFFASDEDEFDEKYKALTEYQKNNAYNIYLGNDKWLPIKKPREIGILSSLMERGWEKFFMDGEDVMKDFAGYSAEQLLPPLLDALPTLLVGLWPGNDFGEALRTSAAQAVTSLGPFGNILATSFNVDYRGNPIIPSYLDDSTIPNKDKYGDQTTETAKLIGAALNISPLQVDSVLNNLGIIQTINKEFFTRSEDKSFVGHLASLFGGGLVKDGLYSQKIVTEFYDGRKTVQTAANANKDDIGYQIDAKEYDTMAAFYSAFNNLQKQEKDQTSDLFRENRGTVLDMLSQFSHEMENGIEAPWLTALHDLTYDAAAYNENEAKNSWEEIDTMGFYPQQLNTEFRYKPALYEKQLTSAEYLWYQTNYLANYKVLVTEALEETNGSVKQRVKAVQKAKSEAKDMTDKALYQYLTGGK